MSKALPLSGGGKGEGSKGGDGACPHSLLQVLLSHSRGGREIIPLQIASRFKKLGWKSAVAAPEHSFLAGDARARGLPFESLDNRFPFGVPAFWRLAKLVDRLKPDILVLHFGRDAALWAWASYFVRHRPKTVFCVSVASGVVKKDFYHRWVYGRLDWVTAISRTLYGNVLATLPIPPGRVNRIAWGIEEARFAKMSAPFRARVRRVGTLARLARGKGQDDLIRAWGRIGAKFPGAKLILAGGAGPGDGPYVSHLKTLISKYRGSKSVEFLGHVEDVPRYLRSLDIFVFPSHSEAYGVALVEAMAAGLPVAGAAAEGVLEIIRPGKDGLLFDPGDPDSLARTLGQLLDSGALRKRLGKAARTRALENMGLGRTVKLYEKLFLSLLGGRQQDSCPLA